MWVPCASLHQRVLEIYIHSSMHGSGGKDVRMYLTPLICKDVCIST